MVKTALSSCMFWLLVTILTEHLGFLEDIEVRKGRK
jgi:hypothetical protein